MTSEKANYLNLKKQYEIAINNENYDLAETLEDALVDAESDFITCVLNYLRTTGNIDLANFWEDNWTKEFDKFINMALKLQVSGI